MKWFVRIIGIVVLVLAASACHQNGTVFAVDTTFDTVDSNPGDGFCNDVNGECSLRAAVMEANALPGVEEIRLNGLTSTLTRQVFNGDTALNGDLDVYEGVVITGPGTIEGSTYLDSLIETHHSSGLVELKNLDLRNFRLGVEQRGAGLLSIVDVEFSGLVTWPGTAVQTHDGSLWFWSSTVLANGGGGQMLDLAGDEADIQNATFIDVRESAVLARAGTVRIRHSTFLSLFSVYDDPALLESGGEITVERSLIYDPRGCGSGVESLGYNVVLDESCSSHSTDVTETVANWVPVLDHSGAVPVVAPPGGSAAFNIAPGTGCTTGMVDARGTTRPLQGSCDAGAIEVEAGACDLSDIGSGLDFCDLSDLDLRPYDFTGARLRGANLSMSNLDGVTLTDADLSDANLRYATLRGAMANGADFTRAGTGGADFSNLTAQGASFRFSNMPHAVGGDFRNADFRSCRCGYLVGVDVRGASFVGAFFYEGQIVDTNVDGADFTDAAIWSMRSSGVTGTPAALPPTVRVGGGVFINPGAGLIGVDLSGFDFDELSIQYTLVRDSDLSNSDLSNTSWGQATEFVRTNLDGAVVSGASLPHHLVVSSFVGVDFTGLDLQDREFNSATLVGADFTNVNLARADFGNALMLWNTYDNTICPSGMNSGANGGNCDGQFVFGAPQAPGAPVPEEFQGREAEFATLGGN